MATQGEGRAIPAPATQQDMYLAAIVEELERLNANIERLVVDAPPVEVSAGEVELRESESKPKKAAHRDAARG